MQHIGGTIAVANGAGVSASFQIPTWANFVGFMFPDMTDGDITMSGSLDDSTFVPIMDPADGQDFLTVASGQDPCLVDVSDFVRFLPPHIYLRLNCANQGAARTIYWWAKG